MGSRTDLGEECPQNHKLLKTLFSTKYSRNNQILIFVLEWWSRVEFRGFDRLTRYLSVLYTMAMTKQTERPLSRAIKSRYMDIGQQRGRFCMQVNGRGLWPNFAWRPPVSDMAYLIVLTYSRPIAVLFVYIKGNERWWKISFLWYCIGELTFWNIQAAIRKQKFGWFPFQIALDIKGTNIW